MDPTVEDVNIADKETRERLTAALCDRVVAAVGASADRDDRLRTYDDMIECIGDISNTNKLWQGACDLVDPITKEAFITVVSMFTQAFSKAPYWIVEADDPDDEDSARKQEPYLTYLAERGKLADNLQSLAYGCARDSVGVLYYGWRQDWRYRRSTKFRSVDGAEVVTAGERDGEKSYEEVQERERVLVYDGPEFRVPDFADFYTDPPNATSIEHAWGCGERKWFTEDELLEGVDRYGFDAESVMELIRKGPTHAYSDSDTDYRAHQDLRDGVSDSQQPGEGRGLYELFFWFGKLPRLLDENQEEVVPENLRDDEFFYILAPKDRLVLRMTWIEEGEKPYILFHMFAKLNRLQGGCVPEFLDSIQAEANANVRHEIDSMNLRTTPVIKVLEDTASNASRYQIYPGAIWPVKSLQDAEPVHWDAGTRDGMAYQQWLGGRAKALIAAEGQGQLGNKVRKQAEIQNIEAASQAKFDLYLANFARGMRELAPKLISLAERHMTDSDVFVSDDKPMTIASADLRGRFQYKPTLSAATANPQQRQERDQLAMQVQMGYFQAADSMPQHAPQLWHGARAVLLSVGVHAPEQLIGAEPSPPPAPNQLQGMLAQMNGGEPNAGNGHALAGAPLGQPRG